MFLNQGEVEAKRAEIKAYFNATYDAYETLFETLVSDEAYYERPCELRHPLIFYFGHTATFFTNKLVLAKLLPERINPKIESMCAIGVDEMSWDDLDESHYDWPSVDAVREYRQQVRDAVNQLIDSVDFHLPIDWESPMWPVMMGIEHERIHLETSSVLIRQLPIESVKPHPLFPVCPDSGQAPETFCSTSPAGASPSTTKTRRKPMAGTMNTASIKPMSATLKPPLFWCPTINIWSLSKPAGTTTRNIGPKRAIAGVSSRRTNIRPFG